MHGVLASKYNKMMNDYYQEKYELLASFVPPRPCCALFKGTFQRLLLVRMCEVNRNN